MLSLTGEYALRAMVYLTAHAEDWPIPGRRIAEGAGIPRKYLSVILGDLVRGGILASSPGPGGGFRMVRPPKDIRLFEVLAPFGPILRNGRPCPFCKEECSNDNLCAGHDRWQRIRETYSRFLHETTVFDVSVKRRKRRRSGSCTRI